MDGKGTEVSIKSSILDHGIVEGKGGKSLPWHCAKARGGKFKQRLRI